MWWISRTVVSCGENGGDGAVVVCGYFNNARSMRFLAIADIHWIEGMLSVNVDMMSS